MQAGFTRVPLNLPAKVSTLVLAENVIALEDDSFGKYQSLKYLYVNHTDLNL